MRILGFVVIATVFEAFGDAIMRIALQSSAQLAPRIGLFALASGLLALCGLSLNLAPVEFASVTGLYMASLFVMFQVVNFILFKNVPSIGVLVGGGFIIVGAPIVYVLK